MAEGRFARKNRHSHLTALVQIAFRLAGIRRFMETTRYRYARTRTEA